MCWAVGPLPGFSGQWTCCRFCAGFAQGTFVKTDTAELELRDSPWGRLSPLSQDHHQPVMQTEDGRPGKWGGAESSCKTLSPLSPLTSLSLLSPCQQLLPFPLQITPVTLEFRTKTQKGGCLASPVSPEAGKQNRDLCGQGRNAGRASHSSSCSRQSFYTVTTTPENISTYYSVAVF